MGISSIFKSSKILPQTSMNMAYANLGHPEFGETEKRSGFKGRLTDRLVSNLVDKRGLVQTKGPTASPLQQFLDRGPNPRSEVIDPINQFLGSQDSYLNEARARGDRDYGTIRGYATNLFEHPVSDESRGRIRGNGVFDEFSRTGGISDADRTNLRARGQSDVASSFDVFRRNAERAQAATGGFNPGYAAQNRLMARDQSRAAHDAALNTELGILDKTISGRQWGAEGLSNAEKALVAAELQGKGLGMGALQHLYSTPGEGERAFGQVSQNKLGGLGLLSGAYDKATSNYLNALGLDRDTIIKIMQLQQGNVGPSPFEKYGPMAADIISSIASAFTGAPKVNMGSAKPKPRKPVSTSYA